MHFGCASGTRAFISDSARGRLLSGVWLSGGPQTSVVTAEIELAMASAVRIQIEAHGTPWCAGETTISAVRLERY
jgi:hypothetical protein